MSQVKSNATHFANVTYMVGDKPLFHPAKGIPLNDQRPKDAWFISKIDEINEKAKSDGLWTKTVIHQYNSETSATSADELLGSL
jgi:hypothetical protein